jgi:hypothetical protein
MNPASDPSASELMPSKRRVISDGAAGRSSAPGSGRGIDAVDDQVGHAMRERVDDEEGRGPAPASPPAPCSTARRCSALSFARWSRQLRTTAVRFVFTSIVGCPEHGFG